MKKVFTPMLKNRSFSLHKIEQRENFFYDAMELN